MSKIQINIQNYLNLTIPRSPPRRIFDFLRGYRIYLLPLAGKTLGLEGQPKGPDKEEG